MTVPHHPSAEAIRNLRNTAHTVPELLTFFGYRYRNYESVSNIDAALQAVGLTTDPLFAYCGRNATVEVVDADSAEEPADEVEETEDLEPGALPQRRFLVSDLPSATAGLLSIGSDDTLSRAIHRMQDGGYSQIPVIDGDSSLKGIVTWKSVANMYLHSGGPYTLAKAMETAQTVELHLELFPEIPRLCTHGYLLVRDNDGRLSGIITPTDITNRFHETALPFFLIGEIELHLRECLEARLSADAIRAVQPKNKKSGKITDLMFGDYLKLLRPNPQNVAFDTAANANWKALGWHGIDRTLFIEQLTQVKNIRNSIAHFDAKPPSATDLDVLLKFSNLLRVLK